MKFIKIIIKLIIIFICFSTACHAQDHNRIVWKYGVAIINERSKYIDPKRLDQSALPIAESTIRQYKKAGKNIIGVGYIHWYDDVMFVFSTSTKEPDVEIFESKREYKFKILNNQMFLSEDGLNWELLEVDIVDESPKQPKGERAVPIFMIIHLKCKWFEGDYELIGTTG